MQRRRSPASSPMLARTAQVLVSDRKCQGLVLAVVVFAAVALLLLSQHAPAPDSPTLPRHFLLKEASGELQPLQMRLSRVCKADFVLGIATPGDQRHVLVSLAQDPTCASALTFAQSWELRRQSPAQVAHRHHRFRAQSCGSRVARTVCNLYSWHLPASPAAPA